MARFIVSTKLLRAPGTIIAVAALILVLCFSRVAAAQVPATAPPSPTVAESVSAEIILDGDVLLDGRESTAILKLVNLTDQSFTVSPPRPITPPEIRITAEASIPRPLAPRSVLLLPLRIRVAPQTVLISGKHTIGVVARISRDTPDRPWTGEVAATKEITAGVPGMTEVQNVLQIPSFLLLPGLLFVASCMALRAMLKQGGGATLALVWSPWLWIIAVSFSGLVAYVYPEVSTWFGPVRRNILYGYSLSDVAAVWIGSIGLGFAAALVWRGGELIGAGYKAYYSFKQGEEPLAFLVRMERIVKTHRFAFVEKEGKRLYRLNPRETGEKRWAAPAIKLTATDANFDLRAIGSAARQNDPRALRDLLTRHTAAGDISLFWDEVGAEKGPRQASATEFAQLDAQRTESIVRVGP